MKVGTGNVSALLSGDGLDMVNDLLAKVAPNAKNLIESEFEKIYQNAYENWPVRKIRKRTSTGLIRESARQMTKDRSDWNFKQALAVAYSLQKKNKLVISESVREKKREFAITNKSQFSKNKRRNQTDYEFRDRIRYWQYRCLCLGNKNRCRFRFFSSSWCTSSK